MEVLFRFYDMECCIVADASWSAEDWRRWGLLATAPEGVQTGEVQPMAAETLVWYALRHPDPEVLGLVSFP